MVCTIHLVDNESCLQRALIFTFYFFCTLHKDKIFTMPSRQNQTIPQLFRSHFWDKVAFMGLQYSASVCFASLMYDSSQLATSYDPTAWDTGLVLQRAHNVFCNYTYPSQSSSGSSLLSLSVSVLGLGSSSSIFFSVAYVDVGSFDLAGSSYKLL